MSKAWLVDYSDPSSVGSRIRRRRIKRVLQLVDDVIRKNGTCRILDVGGTPAYWSIFPDEMFERLGAPIVLLNLRKVDVAPAERRFVSAFGNACDLSEFGDKSFDLVHSNSVIEHVGAWDAMLSMAKEISRVGRAIYVQTPYFWFPVEPHFITPLLHWLPLSVRVSLARRFALGTWSRAKSVDEAVRAQTSAILLDRAMVGALFPDAVVKFEWFAGLPKSLIVYKEFI